MFRKGLEFSLKQEENEMEEEVERRARDLISVREKLNNFKKNLGDDIGDISEEINASTLLGRADPSIEKLSKDVNQIKTYIVRMLCSKY
jgi:hypothetical protein